MYRISGSYPVIRPIFHYPVSGLLLNYPVSGRISYWYPAGYRIIALLAVTISFRNTPWLLLLLRIMMMLPLITNSYNFVSFHLNLMKLVLNWRINHCLSFPGNIFLFFSWKNLILVRMWTWKNFIPDSMRVNFEILKLHLYMDCHEICF